LSAAPALADAGDWVVRVWAIQLAPNVSSQVTVIRSSVDIDADEVPELDFTYFITNNWTAELILAMTRHDVTDDNSTLGNVDLGKVSLLPLILTLQHHFMPDGKYRPYVGAGINYTIFYDPNAPGGTVTAISYEDNFGWALQTGIDIGINERWAINFDLKKA
jgi:outer membrane protein